LAGRADADVGLLQVYINQNAGFLRPRGRHFPGRRCCCGTFLFRGQLGFSISFLEEMWSRNLANLMMSPLKPVEFVIALMIMSVIRLAIGVVPVTLLAIAFFGFNLFGLGFALVAFFINLLLTSWRSGSSCPAWCCARARRREPRLDHHVHLPAAHLRLLPGGGVAGLAAGRGLAAAADLRVEGMRALMIRPRVPPRPDARVPGAQCGAVHSRRGRLSGAVEKRSPERFPDAERGMTVVFIWLI